MEKLFELLRVSLGKEEKLSKDMTEAEWQTLYKIAEDHAVVGVCMTGVERFCEQGKKPPQTLLLQWIGRTQLIEAQNKRMNEHCVTLLSKLRKDGQRGCILKGQGNAMMYEILRPSLALRRQPGDIDVWMEGGFDKVVLQYVQRILPTVEVNDKHAHFHVFEDTDVEVHFVPSRLANRLLDKKLQQWLASEADRQTRNDTTFGGCELTIPTADFNYVYQMLHIYKHLFNEGIGLRQLMDYYVLMMTSRLSEEEKVFVKEHVGQFGMQKFAEALMWILGYVFHLDASKMLWEPNEKKGRFVLSEVMLMGNFGHSDERFRLKADDSHLQRYWQTLRSKIRFIKYFPSETLWVPIDMFLRFFEIRWFRRKASKMI